MSRGNKQRYEILINHEGNEIIDLNEDSPDEIVERIGIGEYMENFEIEESDIYLILTGVFKQAAIDEFGGIREIINEMKDLDYVENVKKINL